MPTDAQRALWAAIRADPAADTPRLVYADWLDDHGDPARAEFIRVQVRLAQIGPDRRKGRKERPALEAREAELLAAHGDVWLAAVRELFRGADPFDRENRRLDRLPLRRGFPGPSDLNWEQARRLATAGPDLEPVGPFHISDCFAHYDHAAVVAVCRWEGAGCVAGLSVPGATDDDVEALVNSDSLRNLAVLTVWMGTLTDAGAARLRERFGDAVHM